MKQKYAVEVRLKDKTQYLYVWTTSPEEAEQEALSIQDVQAVQKVVNCTELKNAK